MLTAKGRILNCWVNKSIKELFAAKRSEFSAEFMLSCCHCQNAQRCCHLSARRCHHHFDFRLHCQYFSRRAPSRIPIISYFPLVFLPSQSSSSEPCTLLV